MSPSRCYSPLTADSRASDATKNKLDFGSWLLRLPQERVVDGSPVDDDRRGHGFAICLAGWGEAYWGSEVLLSVRRPCASPVPCFLFASLASAAITPIRATGTVCRMWDSNRWSFVLGGLDFASGFPVFMYIAGSPARRSISTGGITEVAEAQSGRSVRFFLSFLKAVVSSSLQHDQRVVFTVRD
ncbi:Ammonium transporter [Mycena sanguinolenta]|uniref:Ammonium transporter n=1 Tax=Mycena sanguinolenta TaxID=230812 RepID=A0A8H7CPT0_9AGAR|nr:Ammonium transporter [Mycena sanguinolenta]